MTLFPQSSERLELKIPKEILINELSKEIDFGASSQIFFSEPEKKFAGQIVGEKFIIKLKTSYTNSFKPIINLTLFEFEKHTEIILEYKLEPLVKIFIWFFISLLTIIQIFFIYSNFNIFISHFEVDFIFPFILFIALMIFSRMGFYMSLEHSDAIIKKILLRTKRKYLK